MAYVSTQDENEDSSQPVQLSDAGATLNSQKGGSGPGTTTSGAPAAQGSNPSSSGSFTNLSKYLDANASGAGNLSNTISGNLGSTISGAQKTVNDQSNQFNTAVSQGTDVYDPNLVKSATTDPTNFLNNTDYMTQLAKLKAGSYSGPSNFEDSQYATTAQTAVLNAQQQAALAGTSGGREQLLRQSNPNTQYTQGGLGLDQFLVQNTPDALSKVTTAAAPAGDLSNLFSTAQTNADKAVTGAQATSAATGTQTNKALSGAVNDYRTQIDNSVTGAQTAQQQNFTNLQKALTAQEQQTAALKGAPTAATPTQVYGVTDAQLAQIGVTRDQWNQLTQLDQQAIAQGNPGVELQDYLTNTPGQFTEGSVATPQQQAWFAALNQLAGTGLSLNQGGSAGSSAYNLSDAYNALLAQLQAKAPTGITGGNASQPSSSVGSTVVGAAGLSTLIQQIADLLKNPKTKQQPDKPTNPQGNPPSGTTPIAPIAVPPYVPTPAAVPQPSVTVEGIPNQPVEPNPGAGGGSIGSVGTAAGAGAAGAALGAVAGASAAAPATAIGIYDLAGNLVAGSTLGAGAGATAGAGAGATAGAGAGATGAGASGAAAGTLGAASAVALPLALMAYAASTKPVTFTREYWNKFINGLAAPKGSTNYNNAFWQLSALLTTNGKDIPPDIAQLAYQNGIKPLSDMLVDKSAPPSQASLQNSKYVKQN